MSKSSRARRIMEAVRPGTNGYSDPDLVTVPCSFSAGLAASPMLSGFTDAIRQIARWFLELIELPRPS